MTSEARHRTEVEVISPGTSVEYLRSARYVLRLLVGIAITALGVVSALVGPNTVAGLWLGIRTTVATWPSWVTGIPAGLVVTAGLLVPLTVVALAAALGRFRDLVTIVCCGLAAALADALIARALTGSVAARVDPLLLDRSVSHLSQAATTGLLAVLVLVGPWAPRWMLRVGWTLVAMDLALRMVNALEPPLLMILLCGVGVTIGALTGLLVGLREVGPTPADVVDALNRTGVHPDRIVVPATPTDDWLVTDHDGRLLRTRVTGRDRWANEVLVRSGRLAIWKGIGERSPYESIRALAEREALVAFRAASGGVRTPAVASIALVGDDVLLTWEELDGTPLSELDDDAFLDVLDDAWHELSLLHLVGIAHRDLDLDHLVVDSDGHVWIVGLDRAEIDPYEGVLAADIAALLAVTAERLGPEVAVRHAVSVMGRARVAEALPRLQTAGMPSGVARQIRMQKVLAPLREEVRRACDLDEAVTAELRRVTPRGAFSVVMGAAAVWFLVPQILDAGDLWGRVTDAHWVWLLVAILASAVSYLGAGLTIVGSVPDPVPVGWSTTAALATSFPNAVAPAGIGGMALGTRYLQKQGVDTAVAVSGTGIRTVVGLVVHVVASAGVLLSLGRTDLLNGLSVSWKTVVVVAAAVIVPGVVAFALPWGRRLITESLWPEVKAAARGVVDVARDPEKLASLLGGSLLVTVTYAICLVVSVRAFGGTTPTVGILIVYLSASVVASVAPTPGGLGAAEAAFVGGLRAAGEDPGVALAAVFLYRFATFWLPILPGWLAMRSLQRRNLL